MSLYGCSQRTTATTAASPSWEVRSTSTNKPRVFELGLSQNTGVAGVYGIGRPSASGVGPTSPVTFVDEGDGNAPTAQTTCCVAWTTTAPTAPNAFNRRISCAATVGVGAIFTFPRGLGIPVSGSIVVWIIATAPVCDVYCVVDE
jgi:hypothetical protein